MTGRNEPCSCGSGKKYKKCCALKNELSNEVLIDEELSRLLQCFLKKRLENELDINELIQYEREWTQKLRGLVDEQLFNHLFPKYFLFVARRDLWKRYVLKALNSPIRAGTKSVLATWQNSFVVFGEVIEVKETSYRVTQALGHETYTVGREKVRIKVGDLIVGIGFPDDRVYVDGVLLVNAQMISKEATEEIIETVTGLAKKSEETRSSAFFKKHLADIYKAFFEWRPEKLYDSPALELSEKELDVVKVANAVLVEAGFYEKDIELTQKVILVYLQEREPIYRKAEVVAAAAVYAMQDFQMYTYDKELYSQKKLAKMFGVSVGSMMNHVDRIEEIIFSLAED